MCLALGVAGCTSSRQVEVPSRTPVFPEQISGGAALIRNPYPEFLFGTDIQALDVAIQPGSLTLEQQVQPNPRLKVTVLPSTRGTAAIAFQETSTWHQPWGAVMIPQERRVFRLFAADRSLGQWLIVLSDVRVRPGVDPIPLTAYRWPRAVVERYARCGIPDFVIDPCTADFYRHALVLVVHSGGRRPGQ
jgi:hypothetical protein